MDDLNHVVSQISIDSFKKNLLPPLRDGLEATVDFVVKTLNASEKPPRKETQLDFCSHLSEVSDAIKLAASELLPGEGLGVVFECNPNPTPLPSLHCATHRKPDSFGLYTKHHGYTTQGTIRWDDVVAAGEISQENTWEMLNDVSIRVACQPYSLDTPPEQ